MMISSTALGVARRRGWVAWRLDIVWPTQFRPQSPPDAYERMEKLQRTVLEKLQAIEERLMSCQPDVGLADYLVRRLDASDCDIKALNEQMRIQASNHMYKDSVYRDIKVLNEQMAIQTSYHMEWYKRDLCVLATEILKWSVGTRGATGGDGRQFYATSVQQDVAIGAQVFHHKVEDTIRNQKLLMSKGTDFR